VSTTTVAAPSALLADLRAALGKDRVHTGTTELNLYRRDGSNMEGSSSVVCFPTTTEEVQACVQAARRHGLPFVARGSGTGLAGGAVPLHGAVLIVTTKMNRVLSVDLDSRQAWVEPGVLNADLSRQLAEHGVHYAPDPSSQQSCSVGGNVATNAGGPHCLAEGVTAMHVLAMEVVLPDGSVTVLGGEDPEPLGLDLRGVFIGGEGMLGIATRICVRLTQDPPEVRTLLLDFDRVEDGAATVSAIIASGLVPAALEMMDAPVTRAVEAYVHAGFPTDAAAILIVELDGLPGAVAAGVERVGEIGRAHGARTVRVAADEAERALIWKGRKTAFGAIARIKPNYYLHDTVVPRARLVEVLSRVYEIAARHELIVMNVFHAGDGNLHPLLVFDKREPGVMARVHAAGEEIVRVSVAAGGVLSGEHGIGLEKRDLMPLLFGPIDLDLQARLREAFDPDGVANPEKVLPAGSRCGDLQQVPAGAWI
jgi:glycolate oxidase